jgi:GTPase SAR1 family protein
MEYLKEEDPEASKILFTGLDGAGKTSIILALKREFSKIAILSPTRGAQRRVFEFLGKAVSEWDLGGQKSYRIAYLKNPGKYFENTEIAIYVIDIQDKKRIPEAIDYLKDVIAQFEELEAEPPIYIFFHKFDSVLERSAYNEYSNLTINLKEDIKSEADYKRLYFYNTSIYDLPSIIKAMSEILLTLYSKSELIEKTIAQFANKVKSDGVVVIDDNSLQIGNYFKNDEIKEILNSSTPYFLTLNDSFKAAEERGGLFNKSDTSVLVQRYKKYFIFTQISLKDDVPPYYLLLVKDEPNYQKEDIESFTNILKQILYK